MVVNSFNRYFASSSEEEHSVKPTKCKELSLVNVQIGINKVELNNSFIEKAICIVYAKENKIGETTENEDENSVEWNQLLPEMFVVRYLLTVSILGKNEWEKCTFKFEVIAKNGKWMNETLGAAEICLAKKVSSTTSNELTIGLETISKADNMKRFIGMLEINITVANN